MGQKHSQKYSLRNDSQQQKNSAKIENEIAFSTDSPSSRPADDQPVVGVNMSPERNDYIRNAASTMAKVWTESAVTATHKNEQQQPAEKSEDNGKDGTEVEAEQPKQALPCEELNEPPTNMRHANGMTDTNAATESAMTPHAEVTQQPAEMAAFESVKEESVEEKATMVRSSALEVEEKEEDREEETGQQQQEEQKSEEEQNDQEQQQPAESEAPSVDGGVPTPTAEAREEAETEVLAAPIPAKDATVEEEQQSLTIVMEQPAEEEKENDLPTEAQQQTSSVGDSKDTAEFGGEEQQQQQQQQQKEEQQECPGGVCAVSASCKPSEL